LLGVEETVLSVFKPSAVSRSSRLRTIVRVEDSCNSPNDDLVDVRNDQQGRILKRITITESCSYALSRSDSLALYSHPKNPSFATSAQLRRRWFWPRPFQRQSGTDGSCCMGVSCQPAHTDQENVLNRLALTCSARFHLLTKSAV